MNLITVCTDGRDIVESADKGMTWHGTIRLFVSVAHFKPVVLLSDCFGSKVLGVVQNAKCFVLKWETSVGFPPALIVTSSLYLDTGFVDILFRVPQCYLFRRRTFLAVTVLKFLQKLALDFPYIWVQFFPRNFAFELNFGSFYNENNEPISAFRNEKGITEISEYIYIYIYIYIGSKKKNYTFITL